MTVLSSVSSNADYEYGKGRRGSRVIFALSAVLICAALVGCSESPDPQIDSAFFTVHILDEPKPDWEPGAVAVTRAGGTGISVIEVLRSHYPECVTHEIRHVFEGAWHDQRTTCR